ncbi:hypothetical protein [Streptomyces mirabilis]|uniref:hypothetical protein n=1 Tax=Streptomyces mirabilis TaxID=68239 RepID=UPI0036968780
MTNTTTATTAEDMITLRVPGRAAALWDDRHEHLATERDALSRDVAAAYLSGQQRAHGKSGKVWVFTTTRTLARAFLAILTAAAEAEPWCDDADTKGAAAALTMVQRYAAKGLTAHVPDGYRMADDAAQAALDADNAKITAEADQRANQAADNATHRAAWQTLTREERTTRTQEILDAAFTVFGLQRTERAAAHVIGGTMISVIDGRLYMEVRRLRDAATAQPAVDASREALEAAGWTVTDWGTHFYAQAPQEAQQTYQGPAPVVARVEWTGTVHGHHNGTMSFPSGATYKITHITHARADRGAKGDHLARPSTGAQHEDGPAITWGLDALAAECAEHAGYTGPVTIEQTRRRSR